MKIVKKSDYNETNFPAINTKLYIQNWGNIRLYSCVVV